MGHMNWSILIILLKTVISTTGGQCNLNPGTCDEWSPCCNTDGWCGAGYGFCGATCFEQGNFKDISCLPKPSCANGPIKLKSDRITGNQGFKGDFMSYDFTIEGDYELVDDVIQLKLSKPNTGATMYSTRFINYGSISADIQMDRTNGLVSSFITMSDVKDEIDFEFVGGKQNEIQTNWFYRGIITEGKDTDGEFHNQPDSSIDWHTYTIDWKPESIIWSIDGKSIRTLKRSSDTLPSTPSRFSFSIWDAGSGPEGTKQWAGGEIDWSKMKDHFSVQVRNVKVQCYGDATSKDSDFTMDPKLGLILKDAPPRLPPNATDINDDESKGGQQHLPTRPGSTFHVISSNSFNLTPCSYLLFLIFFYCLLI